jgi:hypothetical protein
MALRRGINNSSRTAFSGVSCFWVFFDAVTTLLRMWFSFRRLSAQSPGGVEYWFGAMGIRLGLKLPFVCARRCRAGPRVRVRVSPNRQHGSL